MYFPIHSLVDVFFFRFFKNEEILKKNTSTSGCIGKYISLVKMYKKIHNRKIDTANAKDSEFIKKSSWILGHSAAKLKYVQSKIAQMEMFS